jgi:type IV secretory pathway component VirB8
VPPSLILRSLEAKSFKLLSRFDVKNRAAKVIKPIRDVLLKPAQQYSDRTQISINIKYTQFNKKRALLRLAGTLEITNAAMTPLIEKKKSPKIKKYFSLI